MKTPAFCFLFSKKRTNKLAWFLNPRPHRSRCLPAPCPPLPPSRSTLRRPSLWDHCFFLQGYLTYKKRTLLGPYRSPMRRVLGGSTGVGRFLMSKVPLYRWAPPFRSRRPLPTFKGSRQPFLSFIKIHTGNARLLFSNRQETRGGGAPASSFSTFETLTPQKRPRNFSTVSRGRGTPVRRYVS